jgi:ketosteroid isomerase-like protein
MMSSQDAVAVDIFRYGTGDCRRTFRWLPIAAATPSQLRTYKLSRRWEHRDMPHTLRTGAFSPQRNERDRAVIEDVLRFWCVQDVEQTLAYFSDDVVYQLYMCRSATPFGGEVIGIDAVRDLLFDILADFDYVAYVPTVLSVHNGVARIQTSYVLQHRASGEELSGSKRFICTLQDHQISRVFEYHDVALIEAFLRQATGRLFVPPKRLPGRWF